LARRLLRRPLARDPFPSLSLPGRSLLVAPADQAGCRSALNSYSLRTARPQRWSTTSASLPPQCKDCHSPPFRYGVAKPLGRLSRLVAGDVVLDDQRRQGDPSKAQSRLSTDKCSQGIRSSNRKKDQSTHWVWIGTITMIVSLHCGLMF
jgi:hypothetical protein